MKACCANCKTKKEIKNVEEIFATRNYRIIKGRCTGCGKEILGLLKKKKK